MYLKRTFEPNFDLYNIDSVLFVSESEVIQHKSGFQVHYNNTDCETSWKLYHLKDITEDNRVEENKNGKCMFF